MDKLWTASWSEKRAQDLLAACEQSDTWLWVQQYMKPPARVLEAGCGLGQWVRFLTDKGYEAHGMDFSKKAIEDGLRGWPDLKLTCGDLRDTPYEDGFFDGIIALGTIEHDEAGPQAILAEMRRLLSPQGILFSTVPCVNYVRRLGLPAIEDWVVRNRTIRRLTGRRPEVSFYQYMWTPKEYLAILAEAKFEVVRLVPMSPGVWILGRKGSVRYRLACWAHARMPWLMGHMMGAICRKA